jgi:hypothetical protein
LPWRQILLRPVRLPAVRVERAVKAAGAVVVAVVVVAA